MPNYARREQEILSAEQLALTVKSRAPELGKLDDTAILALLDALRGAKDGAEEGPTAGDPGPAEVLAAAIRRVDLERRKRGLKAGKPAAPAPAASMAPAAVPATRRRPATVSRKPAGRKPAETRKTDLRTEPHRVPSRKGKSTATAPAVAVDNEKTVTRNSKMPSTEADKTAKQAARKAEKEATKAAEKEAAREARRAERKAQKDTEKEAARAERRAARKAEKEAERKAMKQAERKAARQGDQAKDDAEPAKKPKAEKSNAEKPKAAKPKAAKADAAKADAPKPTKGKGAATKKEK